MALVIKVEQIVVLLLLMEIGTVVSILARENVWYFVEEARNNEHRNPVDLQRQLPRIET